MRCPWREGQQRLRQQIELTADPGLLELQHELLGYPATPVSERAATAPRNGVVVPLCIRTRLGVLSFMSTTMVFGTSVAITLSELAIEALFPADNETIDIVRGVAA